MENEENKPKAPTQPAKRLSVLSPFSAASPQHRRPLKLLREHNQRKGNVYEADPNIEATFCEQTTIEDPSNISTKSFAEEEGSNINDTNGPDNTSSATISDARTPDIEQMNESERSTVIDKINLSLNHTAIDKTFDDSTRPMNEEEEKIDDANCLTESTSSPTISNLQVTDTEHFNEPVNNSVCSNIEASLSTTPTPAAEDFINNSINASVDADRGKIDACGILDNTSSVIIHDFPAIESDLADDAENTIGGKIDTSSSNITRDVEPTLADELAAIVQPTEAIAPHVDHLWNESHNESCRVPRNAILSESLMDFVVTEKKIEYEMKAEEAYSQLKNKVALLEHQLSVANKEKEDYLFLYENSAQKSKNEINSLRQKCNLLEDEIESLRQKQLDESQVYGLQNIGERLDALMKESEDQAELRSKLEKELIDSQAMLTDITKQFEEKSRCCNDLEAEIKARDEQLLVAKAEIENIQSSQYQQLDGQHSKLQEAQALCEQQSARLHEIEADLQQKNEFADLCRKQLDENSAKLQEVLLVNEQQLARIQELEADLQQKSETVDRCKQQSEEENAKLQEVLLVNEQQLARIQELETDLQQKNDVADLCKQQSGEENAKLQEILLLSEQQLARIQTLEEDLQQKSETVDRCKQQSEEDNAKLQEMMLVNEQQLVRIQELETDLQQKNAIADRCKQQSEEDSAKLQDVLLLSEQQLVRIQKLEADLEQKIDEATSTQQDLNNLRQKCNLLENNLETLHQKQQNDEQIHSLQSLIEKLGVLLKESEAHVIARGKLEQELEEVKLELLNKEKLCEEKSRCCNDLEAEIKARDEQLLVAKAEIENIQSSQYQQLDGQHSKLQEAQALCEQQSARLHEIEADLQQKNEFADLCRKQLDENSAKLQEVLLVNEQQLARIQELETDLQQKNDVANLSKQQSGEENAKLQEMLLLSEQQLARIQKLEADLQQKTDEADKAWKMCDEMDELEDGYKQKLAQSAEEITRLKIKCGEANSAGGLLDVFQQARTSELPPGSVNNSATEDGHSASNSFLNEIPDKTIGFEKTTMANLERSPVRNNTSCKQQ